MIPWQVRWLLVAALALAAVAVWYGAHRALLPFVPEPLASYWAETVKPVGTLVLGWLFLLLLLGTILSFTDARSAHARGDLDRLLRRKRRGLLREATRRDRKRTPWGAGSAGATRREEGARGLCTTYPEEYLDHLVRGQRRRSRRRGAG